MENKSDAAYAFELYCQLTGSDGLDINIVEVLGALKELSVRDNLLLDYRFRKDWLLKDIAEKFAITESSVSSAVRKALSRLRRSGNFIKMSISYLEKQAGEYYFENQELKKQVLFLQKELCKKKVADGEPLTLAEEIILDASPKLDDLGLTPRAYNLMAKYFVKLGRDFHEVTAQDITHEFKDPDKLYDLRGLGDKTASEIVKKLHDVGFKAWAWRFNGVI